MCLIVIAHQCDPEYPLIAAANRDEYHARPTRPACFWPEQPQLLAGRDLQAGGTWLGITRGGRFAAITNFRDPQNTKSAPRSRGELTLDFLLGDNAPQDYLDAIAPQAGDYAGFNLLLGAAGELWYFSNSGGGVRRLPPGIYGLSNALLDTPWPKVLLARQSMREALREPPSHSRLAAVVGDRQQADEAALALHGLEGEMERALSAQFIVDPVYGTRCRTSLWLDRAGHVDFREVSHAGDGSVTGAVEERFRLD